MVAFAIMQPMVQDLVLSSTTGEIVQSSSVYVAFLGSLVSVGLWLALIGLGVIATSKLFHLRSRRPTVITVVCISFLGIAILSALDVLFPHNPRSAASRIFGLFDVALNLLWIYGLWRMKKWGLILLAFSAFVLQLFPVVAHTWTIFDLIFLLPAIIGFLYYPEMS